MYEISLPLNSNERYLSTLAHQNNEIIELLKRMVPQVTADTVVEEVKEIKKRAPRKKVVVEEEITNG